jgi:hypothetical protein
MLTKLGQFLVEINMVGEKQVLPIFNAALFS